jgi:hypothetical protein
MGVRRGEIEKEGRRRIRGRRVEENRKGEEKKKEGTRICLLKISHIFLVIWTVQKEGKQRMGCEISEENEIRYI